MMADHAHEYVPGVDHCVVCYERRDATGGTFTVLDGTVMIVRDSRPVPEVRR